jgi:hypothetical protein
LESSALVKRYVAEPVSSLVAAALARDPRVVTSLLTRLEVRAALAAAHRDGRLADLAATVVRLGRDWTLVLAVAVDVTMLDDAALLTEKHALRAADALQLASALFAAAGEPSRLPFGSFGERLNRAAAAEGFPVLF